MQWRLVVSALVIAAACDRTAAPPPVAAPPVAAEIECVDEVVSVAVADELALDDAVCGEPWHAWQIETKRTVELLRRVAGRAIWLRRRGAAVVVEVRVGERVTASFASPTRILWVPPPTAAVPDVISITRGGTSEQLSLAQLVARYPGEKVSGSGRRRGREVSLCALFEGAAPTAIVEVSGAPPEPPQGFTRAACERDGLLLHASRRGGIQLRDRTKRRYVAAVKHVTVR